MNCVLLQQAAIEVLFFRGLDARNVETARLYGNVNKRLAFGSVALHIFASHFLDFAHGMC